MTIIFHYILQLSRRGTHVKSDYVRAIIQYTRRSSHTRHLRLGFHCCANFTVFPNLIMNGIPPLSKCNKPQDGGLEFRKNTGIMQKLPREIHFSTSAPGLSIPSYLSRIVSQPPQSSFCCPRPPSHHPSNLTSVYSVTVLHLLPP